MNGSADRAAWDRPPRIEVLPLLDVVFLLLVVFVYSMVAMVRAHAVPVELPALATGEAHTAPAVLVVTVAADGALFAGGRAVTGAELADHVAELRRADPALDVLLNADARARHGDVATALDQLRGAGVERLLLVGQPAAGPREGAVDG